MSKDKFKKMLIILMIVFLVSGCTANKMTTQRISQIKRIAIHLDLNNKQFEVFNRIPSARSRESGAIILGAATGGLVGAIVADSIMDNQNGETKKVEKVLKPGDVNASVEKAVFSSLSNVLPLVDPNKIKESGLTEFPFVELDSGERKRDYSSLQKKFGVDTLIRISYSYGLTLFDEKKDPTASIFAYVYVIDLERDETILLRQFSSDVVYRESHQVSEFIDNNARLFKEEIGNAANEIAYLIGLEFGKDISVPKKSYWETYDLVQGS